MTTKTLGFLVTGLLLATAVGTAQALKVERRSHARFCAMHTMLLDALRDGDAALRERLAAQLAGRSSGNPFADLAVALATARGVTPDDAFRVRAGLMVMALPAVVDPDVIGDLHVTVHAPRVIPDVGAYTFGIRVRDAGGQVVREASIDRGARVEDLLRFRATTRIDVSDLPDGPLTVEVDVRMPDGSGPRPTDVGHSVRVWIQRRYKSRADALPLLVDGSAERAEHAVEVAGSIPVSRRDPGSQAILTGAVWEVAATYAAEPTAPSSDPRDALHWAETILSNLQSDRDALAGVTGRGIIGFPLERRDDGAAEIGTMSVRLPASSAHGPLPLLVVVPGTPTWDRDAIRPFSPRSLGPGFGWDALSASGALEDGPFFVAVLESPGRYPNAPRSVVDAVRFLQRVLPVRSDSVFLVGEREGGYAVSRAALAEPGLARGVVLVAGGGFAPRDLVKMPGTAVLAIPAEGHPSTPSLEAMRRAGRGEVEVVERTATPWSVALGLRAPEIASFVARHAGIDTFEAEVAGADEERLGFVIATYPDADRTRAFALAQWLRRDRGVAGARVRPRRTDGEAMQWMVVCYTTAEHGQRDARRLAELEPPDFDPRALAGIDEIAAPTRLAAR